MNELISEGFLRPEPRTFGNNVDIIFVCRRNIRYVATEIKERIELIETLSDDELNLGVGKHAENLFRHMFEKNQFKIVGVNKNEFRGKKWHTKSNLDFIIQRDRVTYGVEVKNTFDYMREDEFEEKLEMCKFLNIIPMFPLRCPSDQQYALMQAVGGLALKFKTRIFPPGNEKFVSSIWHYFRLPVFVWGGIPINIERIFLRFHSTNIP